MRAFWLAGAIWYAWASLTGWLMMTDVYGGSYRAFDYLEAEAKASVARYPLDWSLHKAQHYVHRSLAFARAREKRDAEHQR